MKVQIPQWKDVHGWQYNPAKNYNLGMKKFRNQITFHDSGGRVIHSVRISVAKYRRLNEIYAIDGFKTTDKMIKEMFHKSLGIEIKEDN